MGVFLFLLGVFARYHAPEKRNVRIQVPAENQGMVYVVHGVLHTDSVRILEKHTAHPIAFTQEFIDKNTLVFFIHPAPFPQKIAHIQLYNAITLNPYNLGKPLVRAFKTYFEYFAVYDRYFYFHASILGGIALLFSISLIISIVAQIKLLRDFNLITFCAFLLVAVEEFHIPAFPYFSWIGLSNILLVILIWVSYIIFKYYNNRFQLFQIAIEKERFAWLLLLVFLLVWFPQFPWIHQLLQGGLWLAWLFVFWGILKFRSRISTAFKGINFIGIPLFAVQWIHVFYDSIPGNYSVVLHYTVLIYLMVLAVLIAKFILSEFRNSQNMSKQNQRLEKELGQLQFASVEQERKRLVDELHGDVLNRVHMLSHSLISLKKSDRIIEKEVQETLGALRKYSYSLYPPYIEQLSLLDILHREVERYKPRNPERFNFTFLEQDPTLNQPLLKLWIFRIFKEFISFFELESRTNSVVMQWDTSTENRNVLVLFYVLAEGESPVYKSMVESNVQTYIDYYNAQFDGYIGHNTQGWKFTFEMKSTD